MEESAEGRMERRVEREEETPHRPRLAALRRQLCPAPRVRRGKSRPPASPNGREPRLGGGVRVEELRSAWSALASGQVRGGRKLGCGVGRSSPVDKLLEDLAGSAVRSNYFLVGRAAPRCECFEQSDHTPVVCAARES
eukprot:2012894-Rhodomonas_salina.1